MEFTVADNQSMIAQTVKDFTDKHIRPKMMEWDEAQEFPVDTFKKMGEQGLLGMLVPAEYGGAGLGYFEYVQGIVGSKSLRLHWLINGSAQQFMHRAYYAVW